MTRPQPSRYPVASFGPELMELLLQGAVKEVHVPCPSMTIMKALQMRLHMLRGAMGREKHPSYDLVTKARTALTWDFEKFPSTERNRFPKNATNCVLIVRPNDYQFRDILANVNITASEGAKDILDETPAPTTPPDPSIEPSVEPPQTSPYERFK